ncbi:hypothetical protein [Enterococcus italicus]|uniref:hypothetical protein n=1 Tax=Enterococcus italicus TaxID=246144 RepID=UPI0028A71456|nr:hypothetical protein [Enterococcus italicus]
MSKDYQMKPRDVIFQYKTEKFDKFNDFFQSNGIKLPQVQFLLSLIGRNNNCKVALKENDGSKERQFSRVAYQRVSNEFDSYFGLLTILDNLEKDYHTVINSLAFEKNGNEIGYLDMTNVSTFYQYMLGGIQGGFEILSEYDNSCQDSLQIFDSMYEYIFSAGNVDVLENVAKNIEE